MKQVSLVSMYGKKQQPLNNLIQDCVNIIQQSPIARVFQPYDLNQIHGTIAGMERLTGFPQHYNANLWASQGKKIPMDFSRLMPTLQQHLPMTVRFGGYTPSFQGFNSFGMSPYERSFQIQWATNRVTLIAWPHINGDFTSTAQLQGLREALADNCNINHKYVNDNDLFMAIGKLRPHVLYSQEDKEWLYKAAYAVEQEIREYIARQEIDISLGLENLSIAQYQMTSLSPETTIPHHLTNAKLNEDFISNLYQ